MHHVLAMWGLSVRDAEPLTCVRLLSEFSSHLKEKELLPEKDFIRLESLGHETLRRYYDEYLHQPYPIIHKLEFDISARLGDIPIKGKIDRIDLLDPNTTNAVIYDYKTGTPKAPKQIQEYGYHRQLVFYALLIEKSSLLLEPKEFILEFVGEGAEHPVRRTYTVSQEEKQELAALIEKVWAKILSLDFSPL